MPYLQRMFGALKRQLLSAEPERRTAAWVLNIELSARLGDGRGLEMAPLLTDPRVRTVREVRFILPQGVVASELEAIVDSVVRALPDLARVKFHTSGPVDDGLAERIQRLARSARSARVTVGVTFTLGPDSDACAALCEEDNCLTPVLLCSRTLRATGLDVQWLVPASPTLAYRLEPIFTLARDERLDPVLIPPADSAVEGEAFPPDQLNFVRDFLQYRLLSEERAAAGAERLVFYEWLLGALGEADPSTPADAPPRLTVAPGGDGALELLSGPVLDFGHPSDGAAKRGAAPALSALVDRATEVGEVLWDGDRALFEWLQTQRSAPLARAPKLVGGETLQKVMVIGAYGGEHIGDAAILGGVLLRVHERFGVTEGFLMSQRPVHSQRLVKMLHTPVSLTVEPYEHDRISALIDEVDGVVYAGGPLMDLPKQLVRHLYAVSLARKAQKLVVLEGIGAGPFTRKASEWVARRITTSASRISIRTAADGRISIMEGLEPELGHDPAFDYLATRKKKLSRYRRADKQAVQDILRDTEGKLLVGVNLRPIRPQFTTGVSGAKKTVEYTRLVEERFYERLAAAMRRFQRESKVAPVFVFYPMNSIQFGESDLRCAYRVLRHVRREVDFRIWQGDPSLDGVVALLRKLDLVIAMRFHACIFALSQQRPVIGVDYRPGKRDKVAALLNDRGLGDDVQRIDEMSTDWILGRLHRLAAQNDKGD